MEKKNVFTKKKQAALAVIALLAVGGIGGTVYASSQSKQKLAQAQETIVGKTNELKGLEKKINELYDPKEPDFLVKDVTEEQVNTLRQDVDNESKLPEQLDNRADLSTFKNEQQTVEREMSALEKTFETQKTMNRLFLTDKDKVAMNGTETKKDLPIVDNLQKETIDTVKKEYYQEKAETDYQKTINELVGAAEAQVTQIEKAKEAVIKVFKDNKVVSTDQKLYDAAKAEADKIKNETAKKNLSGQLDKVKADIDKKAKEAEEKAKQEQQAKEAEQVKVTEQEQQKAVETQQQAQQQTQAQTDQGQANNGYVDNGAGAATGNGGYTGGNGGSGYTPPAGGNTGGQGSTGGGGQTTTPPATGGGNSGGGSTGGGSSTPQGYVGPFGSAAEADSYGWANSINGYRTMEIDGLWYVSVY